MNALIYRFKALPRAGRWLIIFIVFVGLYFVVIEPVLERTSHYKTQANVLAKSLSDKAQIRNRIADNAGVIEQLAGLFGRPEAPADRARRSSALEKRINSIFSEHHVSNQRTTYREPSPLTNEPPKALAGSKERLDRLAAELTFETDIPTLMSILSALERAPEVNGVSKVTIRKVAPSGRSRERDGPVQVNLTAETWIVTPVTGQSRPARTGAGGDT